MVNGILIKGRGRFNTKKDSDKEVVTLTLSVWFVCLNTIPDVRHMF